MTTEPAKAQNGVSRRTPIWNVLQALCRFLTTVFFDLKVYGRENVPMHGGVILAPNHESYLDPIVVAVQLDRPLSFLAKSELFDHGAFSWLIRQLNAFPIHQGKGDRGAINETIERLREGHMLNLFPEGSRTYDGKLGPIQPGVALIAKKANVPIVPVAIIGSFAAWPKWRRFPHTGKIRVLYGKPLRVHGMKADEIVKLIDSALRGMIEELKKKG